MKLQGKFETMLGFAAKAGKLGYGSAKCESAIKSGKSGLMLIDEGVSKRTMKDAVAMCDYYEAVLIVISPSGALGHAIGRSGAMMAAVTGEEFSEKLVLLYKQSAESMEV